MKKLTPKQEARLQNKKRKLTAFANISKLNDLDKEKNRAEISFVSGDSESDENSSEKKSITLNDTEPKAKRSKSDCTLSASGTGSLNDDKTSDTIISQEDYIVLKREINHKKRELKNVPKLRLKLFGDSASLAITPSIRTPIFLTDIQHLIMFALFGNSSPCLPSRWCHLEKASKVSHTVVLVIDGLSLHHYSSYESIFDRCSKIFNNKLEVVMPDGGSGQHTVNEFITVPLTDIRQTELVEKYGSLEAALDATKNPVLMVNSVFPVNINYAIKEKPEQIDNENELEIFPRTQLLLSALQMVDEGYPLPLRGELANRYKDFVLTKDAYKEVSAKSPMFALDCEMCRTSAGVNELTRISIINENHESIYETLVCPQNKIVDYLTQYSGITPEMMKNVTKTLPQVQDDVRRLLPADGILVGQSLQSDLMAMRMMHPYVIDTSVIFNISGDRRRKSKLQALASEFLGETIQKNPLGHDSIEDCSASLKLTKLKLTRGIDFGDAILMNRRRFYETKLSSTNDNNVEIETTTTTVNPKTNKKDRSTAVITSCTTNNVNYQEIISRKFKTSNKSTTNTTEDNTTTTKTTTSDDSSTLASKNIKLFENSTNKCAVQKTCQVALDHALTLTHLNVTEKYLNDAKIEKSFKKVDQWIAKIWENIAPKGLFIVLFGGSATTSDASGVVLLQTK